jgi:hypothetical protein
VVDKLQGSAGFRFLILDSFRQHASSQRLGVLKNWVLAAGKVAPVKLPVACVPASLRSPVAGLIHVAFADLASILSRWRKTVVGLER